MHGGMWTLHGFQRRSLIGVVGPDNIGADSGVVHINFSRSDPDFAYTESEGGAQLSIALHTAQAFVWTLLVAVRSGEIERGGPLVVADADSASALRVAYDNRAERFTCSWPVGTKGIDRVDVQENINLQVREDVASTMAWAFIDWPARSSLNSIRDNMRALEEERKR
jgi:hypothetical protein